ncbi:glycosyltransferase [Stenotrophomonas rhizophila]|uniref:glycosyltransferase n=1 Tax=Stenotrophomonas rhizophila TaxID=216778 RepID=UPI001E50953B|nr:glycosyltransferase [Stenotrophomonas rhizophila]MCC7636107.1 glycosyltransferase [Stenotrophomonas rhizophila]MCC7665503.1 glycosyltransferase [Stenotrophomonas rhizophila]
MRRLTVVQLLPALHSGGVERSTLEIASALVAAGHRAIVVSAGGRLVEPLLASGAEHLTLDIGRKSLLTLRHVLSLRRLFLEVAPDIVHARSRLPAWLGLYALRNLPAAQRPHWVTTVHGLNTPGRYSAVMTSGERVICVSNSVRDFVQAHYPGVPAQRLQVIPRGVDVAQFPRVPRQDRRARLAVASQHPTLAGSAPLLLLPGRGTRLKGHRHALALLAGLHAAGVPARLWMPGTREPGRESYVAELDALARTLGVSEALLMTAPTARIAQAYAASDLVLQVSDKAEAFGRTVLEALSVGRPVLGWNHGGVGELLAQLQPSGAVPLHDDQALLARALQLLQQPPALPSRIPFTLQAMQRDTLQLYTSLAG